MRAALITFVALAAACRGPAHNPICGGRNQPCCEEASCDSGLTCEIGRCLAEVACPSVPPSCPASGVEVFAQTTPIDLAVDCNALYWTNIGSKTQPGVIVRQPLCGGTPETLATTGTGSESALLSVGNLWVTPVAVYWARSADDGSGVASSEILTVPLAGGEVSTVQSAQHGVVGVHLMTGDTKNLYWRVSEPNGPSKIVGMPRAGGATFTLASLTAWPAALASNGERVFWTSGTRGGVESVPVEGGAVTTLASGGENSLGLALDAQNVYWTARTHLLSVPLNGGDVVTLAEVSPDSQRGRSVTSQGGWVYWTTSDNGSEGAVLRVRRSGGSVVTIQSEPNPGTIISDATHLFWTRLGRLNDDDPSHNAVMRALLAE